jgi:hypothetical protein
LGESEGMEEKRRKRRDEEGGVRKGEGGDNK